jgi:hypothetical protein
MRRATVIQHLSDDVRHKPQLCSELFVGSAGGIPAEWGTVFGDPVVGTALFDRLLTTSPDDH